MHLVPLSRIADFFPGALDLPGRVAATTLEAYQRDAGLYLEWCGWETARALDPATLRAYRQHLVEHTTRSPNTINRRRAAIQSLVRVSAACGAIDERIAYRFSLVEPVKVSSLRSRVKRPRAFTPEEVRALCDAPDPKTLIGLRDRALLLTLASTGGRVSEILGLEQAHLVPAEGAWFVQVLGKGQAKPRPAPLSLEAAAWMHVWLRTRRQRGIDVPRIFTALKGRDCKLTARGVSRYTVWERVKRYAKQVGVPELTTHNLRHFVGTQMNKRYNLRTAQKVLGHARIETTALHYVFDELPPGLADGLY